MPYTLTKKESGSFGVSGPSGVHAKSTTKAKAKAQIRLLRGVDHGMKPHKKQGMAEGAESKSTTRRKNI